ncbi:hypothetical protein D3C80_1171650 [compost metagenome]
MLYARNRLFDQRFDLFRRVRAAASEITYFTGDHGKTTALLSGTRGFDSGVQRQNIGLKRNPIDYADNVANFLRTGGDVLHGGRNVRSLIATFFGGVCRLLRQVRRLTGVIGVLAHRRRQLFHAGRRLRQRGRLLFCSRGQIVIPRRNF